MARLACALVLLSAVFVVGCGPSMQEVKGTVTAAGKPLPDVQVVFVGATGETAIGRTDASGAYSVTAPPGKYQVSITLPPDKMPMADSANPYATTVKFPFPQKYAAAGTSGLTHEVTGSGTYDIKLD